MSNEPGTVRIAAVVLRVTLALIFISHGVDKLTSDKGVAFGADWAGRLERRISEPPPSALEKLEKLKAEAWLTDVERAKVKDGNLSEEEITQLASQRRNEVRDQLRRAYATDAPPSSLANIRTAAIQYAVTWGEIVGGAALLIGLLTRLVALGMIVIQAGAIYFVTLPLGLTGERGAGYEYNVALIAMCLALVIMGPGGWSIDHFLRWGAKEPQQQAVVQQTVGAGS